MKSIHIDIVDFHPPTIEQIETFVNAVEAAENTKQVTLPLKTSLFKSQE